MLSPDYLEKSFEKRALEALEITLRQIPSIEIKEITLALPGQDLGIDIVVHMDVWGRPHTLVCETKANGQPRYARMAILQLHNWISNFSQNATPIFIAPFLTAETQALCRENGVGFLDLLGNARLAFDNVFIERIVPTKPQSERREIKSLFRRKSGQVLRTLLGDPNREWRVVDLAEKSGVSVGHVSNVRSALIDRELATASRHGLKVTAPDKLLDSWRDAYEGPDCHHATYYTALHGSVLDDAVRHALGNGPWGSRAIYAGLSAAHWIAPYGRTASQYFYTEKGGLERLQTALQLVTAQKGENIFVFLAKDLGVFSDAIEPAPGVFCTSLVQTYLDLWVSGERGREAADHLRRMRLKWLN